VNRPSPVKNDNFFLLLFQALRRRRVSLALRIAAHSLLLVALALIIYAWVVGMQFKHAMQQQADAIGESLVIQTSASAAGLLAANDILSLNVLLSNLVRNPLVAHAAVYSVDGDGRILAEAGTRPTAGVLGDPDGLYSADITFQEVIAGHLRLSLDMRRFQQPMTISLQSMAILSLILLALTLSLSLRLGRQLSTPLMQLRLWLRDPDDPAPGSARQDEIGDLARQLQARLVPERPRPEPQPEAPLLESLDELDRLDDSAFDNTPMHRPADPDATYEEELDEVLLEDEAFDEAPLPHVELPAAEPEPSAVLAIQLGAQDQLRRLPRQRLMSLLERYRDCLEQAARLYQGELHTLKDGSSLVVFHRQEIGEDYLTHATCCGELMRALGHALQIDVADSGITLLLQLGLTRGEQLHGLSQAELLLHDSVLAALALAQHSRNLLLLDQTVAQDPLLRERARLRSIISPEGANCVERLLEPYPSLLERQLGRIQEQAGR